MTAIHLPVEFRLGKPEKIFGQLPNDFEKDMLRPSSKLGVYNLDYRGQKEAIVSIDCKGWSIWGHWLIDIIPRILVIRDMFPDIAFRFVHTEPLPDFAAPLLSHVGIRVERNDAAPDFEAPMIRAHDYFASPLYEHAVAHFPTSSSSSSRKVYVSREKWNRVPARKRRLTNYTEVERLFSECGFEIVHPEQWSVPDQIAFFQGVGFLAGEAGSGLHNSLFMPAGGTVLNIQSGRQTHLIQSSIDRLRGHRSVYVVGAPKTDLWMTNFAVEIGDVTAALDCAARV